MKYYITLAISLSIMANYPSSYEQSRRNFRKLLPQSKVYKISSRVDDDLTIDYYFNDRSEKSRTLLIINTGIHGPEAYLGSMALDYFIKNHQQNVIDQNVDLFLIHSLNPYGFKYDRRFTENNVDLNRNQSLTSALFKTKNEDYKNLFDILNPQEEVKSRKFRFYQTLGSIGLKLLTGTKFSAIRRATAGGQYDYPNGLFFGGNKFEDNSIFLQQILKPHLKGRSKILFLDFHTGLGKREELHLITTSFKNNASASALAKVFPESKHYKVTKPTDKGFYRASGDLLTYISDISPEDAIVISLAAEFGTLGSGTIKQIETVSRMILENQGHFHGYETQKVKEKVKRDYMDLFFPQDESWKETAKLKVRHLFSDNLKSFIKY